MIFLFCSSSEMTISILEKPVLGGTRRLLAADVFMYFQNASGKVSHYIAGIDIGFLVWARGCCIVPKLQLARSIYMQIPTHEIS